MAKKKDALPEDEIAAPETPAEPVKHDVAVKEEVSLAARMTALGASGGLVKRAVKAAEGLALLDTPRIPKVASTGDGFVLPGMSDDETPFKDYKGVILFAEKNKAFYSKTYVQGSSEPPDCYSLDAKKPEADSPNLQNDVCKTCPQNQFGSSSREGAKGKACRDLRNLYFIQGDRVMPTRLMLTPTSLKNFETYVTTLVANGLSLYEVETKIVSAKKNRNDTYAVLNFTKMRVLDEEKDAQELADLKALKLLWLPVMQRAAAVDLMEEAATDLHAEPIKGTPAPGQKVDF